MFVDSSINQLIIAALQLNEHVMFYKKAPKKYFEYHLQCLKHVKWKELY